MTRCAAARYDCVMSSPALAYSTPTTTSADYGHLKLLSIFHYVWGGFIALVSCVFVIHIVLGIVMLANPAAMNSGRPNNPPPPAGLGLVFIGMGAVGVLVGWAVGGLNVFAGRSIAQRRRWLFVLIMAGINCLSVPFGTALGVFTFVVLLRDPVKARFGQLPAYAPPRWPVETYPPPGV